MDTETVSKMDNLGWKWIKWMGKNLKKIYWRETITTVSYTAAGM